jgi:hypothetical protein
MCVVKILAFTSMGCPPSLSGTVQYSTKILLFVTVSLKILSMGIVPPYWNQEQVLGCCRPLGINLKNSIIFSVKAAVAHGSFQIFFVGFLISAIGATSSGTQNRKFSVFGTLIKIPGTVEVFIYITFA